MCRIYALVTALLCFAFVFNQVLSATTDKPSHEAIIKIKSTAKPKKSLIRKIIPDVKKSSEDLNLVEKLALKASKLSERSSKFVQNSIFLIAGATTILYLARSIFKSPQEAAKENGMLHKLLEAESKADAAKFTMPSVSTHHSALVRFVGHNYYAIVVLLVFLNACLVMMGVSGHECH